MRNRDLFAPLSEDLVREALQRSKKQARQRMQTEAQRALDYLCNRQLEHVRQEIYRRYEQTQTQAGPQQGIAPVTVPLVQRYIAEASDAYNRAVTRKLVMLDGEENEATKQLTQTYVAELDACGFDGRMHHFDEMLNLAQTCGLWMQVKRGKLRPVITYAHNIHEVLPLDADWLDPSDEEDYLGFVIELAGTASDASQSQARQFALVTPAETVFYETRNGDPYSMPENERTYPNPYRWPQVIDSDDHRGSESVLPLQMLAIGHMRQPTDAILQDSDADIVTANHEINIQLSVLLDTMRVQGWSVPVIKVINETWAPATKSLGTRFPLVLRPEESAEMLSAATPYEALVSTLQSFVGLLAVAHRQSPNDFAVDGQTPQSGFAKLVDSLPKLEARRERCARLKRFEELQVWPRAAACLQYLGKMPADLSGVKLEVSFADIEFPLTVDEQAKADEHALKHNFTTEAKLVAKRTGMSLAEAEAEIKANREVNAASMPVTTPVAAGGAFGGSVGSLIGRRSRAPVETPPKS